MLLRLLYLVHQGGKEHCNNEEEVRRGFVAHFAVQRYTIFSLKEICYAPEDEQNVALRQWFLNLSEILNPTSVVQVCTEPLVITRSGFKKFWWEDVVLY